MLIAVDSDEKRIRGRDAVKRNNYYCPVCHQKVTFKKGEIKIPHFAHRSKSDCINAGESVEHMEMKDVLIKHLEAINKDHGKEIIKSIIPEKTHFEDGILKRVSDIFLIYNKFNVVLECQHSPIDIQTFEERTIYYLDQKFLILWIFDHESYYKTVKRGKKGVDFLKTPNIFKHLTERNWNILFLNRKTKKLSKLEIFDYKYAKGSMSKKTKTLAFFRLFPVRLQEMISLVQEKIEKKWGFIHRELTDFRMTKQVSEEPEKVHKKEEIFVLPKDLPSLNKKPLDSPINVKSLFSILNAEEI